MQLKTVEERARTLGHKVIAAIKQFQEEKPRRQTLWLDDVILDEFTQDRADIHTSLVAAVEGMPDMYPVDIFPEPWSGWQEDIDALAKTKGRRIDCISAHYARWQNKVTKDDTLTIINSIFKE